jgi:hypothetical protein
MTPTRHTKTTCCYCGVGCGVIIESDGAQVLGVRGDPEHPANSGLLCSKGSTLHLSVRPDHLQLRQRRRGGNCGGAGGHAGCRRAEPGRIAAAIEMRYRLRLLRAGMEENAFRSAGIAAGGITP